MIELIAHNLAPIMFLSLIAFLLLGYPVAFSLAANGLLFFVIAVELSPYSNEIALDWPLLQTLPGRVLDVMRNDTLLAIPFFTFMGIILEKSGMAEDLLDTIGQLFGPIRGGLAYAVILVGALLAATTGVVAASVIAMGLISLPIMLRYGYDRPLATGVIAASGTLAQIIPPSLVLIVLADQLGRSVGDMYAGAMIPGLMLAGLYCAYVFFVSIVSPQKVPALPLAARTLKGSPAPLLAILAGTLVIGLAAYWLLARQMETGAGIWAATIATVATYLFALADKHLKLGRLSHLVQQVVIVLVPPLGLIFLVLGTIFLGIATPTEGGAMGAAGALLMAIAKRRLSFRLLSDALDATTRLSCFVLFILIGSRIFSLTFYGINGHVWVEELFLSLPGGVMGFPDRRQHPGLHPRLLHRLLRDRLHRRAAAGPGCGKARHRSRLVRRAAGREPADQLPHAALWLCAVLHALGGAGEGLYRQGHRRKDRRHLDHADLPRCRVLHHPAGHHDR